VPKHDPAFKVFEHWRTVMKKGPATKFDAKRRRAVEARLREGRAVEDLMRAIDGCAASPFHMGQNDRRRRFNDLELICRDGPHVEQTIEGASAPTTRR
jgi:hypothetical protein